MKPETRTVKDLFERDVRYVVPLYQRPYVWDAERQWQPLWDDIQTILDHRLNGAGDDGFSHFLGAIVLEQVIHAPGEIPIFTVIDGQQRLTTLQLLLSAASRTAETVGADKEAKILERLTSNDELTAEGFELYKVWPTNDNRTAFEAVMKPGGPPANREDDPRNRIDEAYAFFRNTINDWLADEDDDEVRLERMTLLRTTLSDLLKVVSITLEPGDNAQIIFETLNARGTPLLALDLVKNVVFHAADGEGLDVESLYYNAWQPELDQPYWRQEIRQGRLTRPRADIFLMHWLAMKLREVVPATELYTIFRHRILNVPDPLPADELIHELRRDAEIMRSFDRQPAGSVEAVFFERLDLLDTTVFMPVVLLLFRDTRVTTERRRRALRILESWLVRRSLMRLTARNYNMQVPVILARVSEDPEHADEVILRHFRAGEGEISRWPTDDELRKSLTRKSLYNSVAARRIVMALAAIEESLYTSKVDVPFIPKTLSLEHLMPQSWDAHWPLPEDKDPVVAKEERDARIHRLGNLTLTAQPLNAAMSNAAWVVKREQLNKATRLLLNVELLDDYLEFDERAIDARSEALAARLLKLWPGPDDWGGEEAEAPAEIDALGEGETLAGETGRLAELGPVESELLGAPVTAAEGNDPDSGLSPDDRYAELLREAAPGGVVDVVRERFFGVRYRLELPDGVTVKCAYLDADLLPAEIPLRLYPADTLEQARLFYADRDRCDRVLALRDRGWEIEPNFHFGFMTRGLTWTRARVTTDEYVSYWLDRIESTMAIPREDWDAELAHLIEDRIFDPKDLEQFWADFRDTARESASPRPGISLVRRWPAADAERPGFAEELRASIWEALVALGEPLTALGMAAVR